MKSSLLSRLVCPSCSSALALEQFRARNGITEEGVLLCGTCAVWYPIFSSVPVLLVFRTTFHEWFAREKTLELARFSGYRAPGGSPRPGEESAQETFTEEWGRIRESDLSFTYSHDDLVELNRQVWLRRALGSEEQGSPESILDVGCGAGREAVALHALAPQAGVFAVDVNFALLGSAAVRQAPDGLHFVIASLFDLPFERSSFDLVYSQGVLHHTFSTAKAFDAIAAYVRTNGYFFVWLYGLDDHLTLRGRRRVATKAGLLLEGLLRPLLSRSPSGVRNGFFAGGSRLAHPLLKPRMRHASSWELENTEAYLRDWLSPRYARKHSYNEVIEWFEEHGFVIVDTQSPRSYRRLFGDRLWGVGLTGQKRE